MTSDASTKFTMQSHSTPPFLLWSLEQSCPVRGLEDGADPERVERQLRAARATGEAFREGRVCDGYGLCPPRGFHIERTLAMYGGLDAVRRACGDCPANVLPESVIAGEHSTRLAGCFGLVPLLTDIAERTNTSEWEFGELFPATRPRWYGLWMASPLSTAQAIAIGSRIESLAAKLTGDQSAIAAEWRFFVSACRAATEANLRLHVQFYPPGQVDRGWWRLSPHCPRCRGPWTGQLSSEPSRSPKARECPACGYVGQPAPDKKRRARGPRPYLMLGRVLGDEGARELVAKFAAQSSRTMPAAPQQSPDQERSPHELVPPSSPPAD
jgi:hypothetical protein